MKRLFTIFTLMWLTATSAMAQQSDGEERFNRFIAFAENLEQESRKAYQLRRENRSELYVEAMKQYAESPTVMEDIDRVAAQADSLLHRMVELARENKPEQVWEIYEEGDNNYILLSYFSTDELGFSFHVGFLTTVLFNIFPEEEATLASQRVIEPFVGVMEAYHTAGGKINVEVYLESKNILIDIYSQTQQIEKATEACQKILEVLEGESKEYDIERLQAIDCYAMFKCYLLKESVEPSVIKRGLYICGRMLADESYDQEQKQLVKELKQNLMSYQQEE